VRPVYLSLLWGLLLLSCSDKTPPAPYTEDEVQRLNREIRLNSLTPDQYVTDLLAENDRVMVTESAGYGEGLEVLKYLLPLLHSRGITRLDLWFLPRDGFVQANALVNASRFFEESAADLMGRASYRYLYGEHLEFLRYLYDFNHTLEEGEPRLVLTDLTSPAEEGIKGLLYGTEPLAGVPSLYIQSPPEWRKRVKGGEKTLIDRLNQLYDGSEGAPFFFVAPSDHFLWEKTGEEALLVLARPLSLSPCTPLAGGINRTNYLAALKDFPDIPLKKPAPAAIYLMKRAQRRYLKELVNSP